MIPIRTHLVWPFDQKTRLIFLKKCNNDYENSRSISYDQGILEKFRSELFWFGLIENDKEFCLIIHQFQKNSKVIFFLKGKFYIHISRWLRIYFGLVLVGIPLRTVAGLLTMAIRVVKFSNVGYKIRKMFA